MTKKNLVSNRAAGIIDLRARGIDEAQAADLRSRLATFAEDWNSPEMDIYDDYDAARANLRARRRTTAVGKQ